MNDNKPKTKTHKTGFGIVTIISVVFTVLGGFNDAAEFWERLDAYGIRQALSGSALVLIFAAVAVLFSLVYLFSAWRAKRSDRKQMLNLVRQAEEAKARGEEFVMPDKTVGSKVGSALSAVLDTLTKTLIAVFILGLIVAAVFIGLKVTEIQNRPTFNVIEAVDMTDCVKGYDGLGYIDETRIVYNLPEDIIEVYKDSKNYKKTKDYSDQQEIWTQFLRDLEYKIEPDTSQGGTLKNGDTITITATLPGYSVPNLQGELNIELAGIGESKEMTVSGLPYKYTDAATVLNEQHDFIGAAYEKLKLESYKEFKNFQTPDYSSFIFDAVYLCKPKYNEDTNPDALLMIAHTDVDPGTEYANTHTMVFYSYPFDSNVKTSDVENENEYSTGEEVYVSVDFRKYTTPDKVKEAFEAGLYFSASTAYDMIEIPWEAQ